MGVKFSVKWDRPIHLEKPEFQTDHGEEDLPEANSKEAALAIIERWKPWLRTNKMSNIVLHEQEQNSTYTEYLIQTPISLE